MLSSASVASCMHTYAFNGNRISFRQGQALMVNATQMAKPFAKKPRNWLDLPSTMQFIDTLLAVRKSDRSAMISTINGIGTWFHEDVALEFARWLSPEFAIWCNDRIKELLTQGMTAIDLTRYVPIQQYREQVRLAEFERREAETWYRRSQAYLSLLEKSAENQAKMSQAMLSLSQASAVSVPAAPQASKWMTVVGYASLHNIPCSLSMAGQLGRKAASLCAKQGITPDTIPDPRFGRVNAYPAEILKQVFEQAK